MEKAQQELCLSRTQTHCSFQVGRSISVILGCMDPKFRGVLEALFWFSLGVLTYACLIHLHRVR